MMNLSHVGTAAISYLCFPPPLFYITPNFGLNPNTDTDTNNGVVIKTHPLIQEGY